MASSCYPASWHFWSMCTFCEIIPLGTLRRIRLFSRETTISLCTHHKTAVILIVLNDCLRLSKNTLVISNKHEDLKHTCWETGDARYEIQQEEKQQGGTFENYRMLCHQNTFLKTKQGRSVLCNDEMTRNCKRKGITQEGDRKKYSRRKTDGRVQ